MGAETGAPDCQITEAMVEAAARGWYEAQMASLFRAAPRWEAPLVNDQYRDLRRDWARAALEAAFRTPRASELRGEAQ